MSEHRETTRRMRRSATALRPAVAIMGSLGVAVGLAMAPLPASAAPQAKPKVVGVSLSSASMKVVSSTHKALRITIYGGHYKSGTYSSSNVSVNLSNRSGGESHFWTFKAPKKTLTVNNKGRGTFGLSNAKLGKFGKIKITTKPVGKAKTSKCNGSALSKTQRVNLSGWVYFNTQSKGKHKWGSVGSKSRAFHFSGKSYVVWSYASSGDTSGCYPQTSPTCQFGVSWGASSGKGSLYGDTAGTRNSISGSRSVKLTKPKGAFRSDYLLAKLKKAPALTVATDGSATLKVSGAGKGSTGSATLTSTSPSTSYPSTCGRTHIATSTQSWSGTWKNGSKPLQVKADCFGAIKVVSTEFAYFSRTTRGTA